MEEKKETNLKSGAGRWQEKVKNARKETAAQEKTESATGLRVLAILFWILAFSMELCAGRLFAKTGDGGFYPVGCAVCAMVLDLVLLILGSSLWKKANRKNPVTKENKKFWFYNQFNRIMGSLAFAPFMFLVIFNKSTDGKGKALSIVAGVISVGLFLILLL